MKTLIGILKDILRYFGQYRGQFIPDRTFTPVSGIDAIRIFVSSTFQDMQEEREALRRDVWPTVRRACEERGLAFLEVDLRWGVTEEESQHGEVLEICLDEIDRCRPWVLGFLGKRYGWVDPKARQRIEGRDHFKALLPFVEASVTEIELRHAIVNPPPAVPSPACLLYWRTEASEVSPFEALAKDIDLAGITIQPSKGTAEDFAAKVRQDLLDLLAKRAPARPLESAAQLRTRLLIKSRSRNMAPRREVDVLSQHIAAASPLIAVTGPSGSGKSAIIAAAVGRSKSRSEFRTVASLSPEGFRPWTASYLDILTSISGNIGHISGPSDLSKRTLEALSVLASFGPLVVFIDDVNTNDHSWLPEAIPGVTFVVGLMEPPKQSGWVNVQVRNPEPFLAKEIISGHLLEFGRLLAPLQLERLTHIQRSARFVALLAEELRHIPRFEDLDAAIFQLEEITDELMLADQVVSRVLADRGVAVAPILLALSLSFEGLSHELLAAFAKGKPASRLAIALFIDSLRGHLVEANGRFFLATPELRRAVLSRIGGEEAERAMRRQIATAALRLAGEPGAAAEAIAQMEHLKDTEVMAEALARPEVAEPLLRRSPELLSNLWSMEDAAAVFEEWMGKGSPALIALAAEFLSRRGAPTLTWRLADDALKRADHDFAAKARALSVLSRLEEGAGHLKEAKFLAAQAGEAAQASGLPGLAALGPVNVLRIDFILEGEIAVEQRGKEVRQIAESAPDGRALAVLLLIEGLAALDRGNHKAAQKTFMGLKRLSVRDGDLSSIAAAEAGLARVAHAKGRRTEAESLAARVLATGEVLGDIPLQLEALGIFSIAAMDDVRSFGIARTYIARRRDLALSTGHTLPALEADLDEARLLVRHAITREVGLQLALEAIKKCHLIGILHKFSEFNLE